MKIASRAPTHTHTHMEPSTGTFLFSVRFMCCRYICGLLQRQLSFFLLVPGYGQRFRFFCIRCSFNCLPLLWHAQNKQILMGGERKSMLKNVCWLRLLLQFYEGFFLRSFHLSPSVLFIYVVHECGFYLICLPVYRNVFAGRTNAPSRLSHIKHKCKDKH